MDPWYIDPLHLSIRLLLALIVGGLIGIEREMSSSAAGLRTHILVCVGATLIMLISIYGFNAFVDETNVRIDPSRLAAQVVSGIGFLGAGTILITGNVIKGLTTAASLWVVAAIGLAIGAGFYYPAIFTCILVLISLWVLNKAEKRFLNTKKQVLCKVHVSDQIGIMGRLSGIIGGCNGEIRKMAVDAEESIDNMHISYTLLIARNNVPNLIDQIRAVDGVSHISVE